MIINGVQWNPWDHNPVIIRFQSHHVLFSVLNDQIVFFVELHYFGWTTLLYFRGMERLVNTQKNLNLIYCFNFWYTKNSSWCLFVYSPNSLILIQAPSEIQKVRVWGRVIGSSRFRDFTKASFSFSFLAFSFNQCKRGTLGIHFNSTLASLTADRKIHQLMLHHYDKQRIRSINAWRHRYLVSRLGSLR